MSIDLIIPSGLSTPSLFSTPSHRRRERSIDAARQRTSLSRSAIKSIFRRIRSSSSTVHRLSHRLLAEHSLGLRYVRHAVAALILRAHRPSRARSRPAVSSLHLKFSAPPSSHRWLSTSIVPTADRPIPRESRPPQVFRTSSLNRPISRQRERRNQETCFTCSPGHRCPR